MKIFKGQLMQATKLWQKLTWPFIWECKKKDSNFSLTISKLTWNGIDKYSFGISTSNEDPVKIKLKFDQVQGNYIKSQPLHQSQKIIDENESGILIELDLTISPELVMQLLSFGSKVQVMGPKELRLKLKEELESALVRYD